MLLGISPELIFFLGGGMVFSLFSCTNVREYVVSLV